MLGGSCLIPGAPDIMFVAVIIDRHHVEAVRDLPQH